MNCQNVCYSGIYFALPSIRIVRIYTMSLIIPNATARRNVTITLTFHKVPTVAIQAKTNKTAGRHNVRHTADTLYNSQWSPTAGRVTSCATCQDRVTWLETHNGDRIGRNRGDVACHMPYLARRHRFGNLMGRCVPVYWRIDTNICFCSLVIAGVKRIALTWIVSKWHHVGM